ncbi:MAG: thioredoxin family protein [Thermoguttaceae bacterium]|nr:thioredoxin family protein [Thermoguttaceae bacterium]MDW8080099.1 thioredoxin family protein [Thermoguttaceae bacterium]
MKQKVLFYHAGCPVCQDAERAVLELLDPARFEVEVIHLGQQKDRLGEAERLGVQSVPALVVNNRVFHINFGAKLTDLK